MQEESKETLLDKKLYGKFLRDLRKLPDEIVALIEGRVVEKKDRHYAQYKRYHLGQ